MRRPALHHPSVRRAVRRGFTIVELMVAAVIIAFVLGAVATSIAQLSRAKNTSKRHLDAYLRADAALSELRATVTSVIRSDDLFDCRVLLYDGEYDDMPRDELLVFNTTLNAVHNVEYSGEGIEYESQYRVEVDDLGPVLWRRRDAVTDVMPLGGGTAMPFIEGVLGLQIQAYDGNEWWDDWDSDFDGMPLAVRITVTTSGHRPGEDPYDAPLATLRTVVPIDRVPMLAERQLPTEEDEELLDEELDQMFADYAQQVADEGQEDGGAGTTGDGGGGDLGRDRGRGGGDASPRGGTGRQGGRSSGGRSSGGAVPQSSGGRRGGSNMGGPPE